MAAAVWIDRIAPAVRLPASEPGRALVVLRRSRAEVGAASGPSLPRFLPGDRFEFAVREPSSTGEAIQLSRKFQVAAVDADRIRWTIGPESITTTLNPMAPALAWRATEEGEGTRQLFGDPLALFPLSKGKKISVRSEGPGGDSWSCESIDVERVTVAAGSFRAWRIECGNAAATSKDTYFYSDEVGFWVSRLSRFQRGSESIERVYDLVASTRLSQNLVPAN